MPTKQGKANGGLFTILIIVSVILIRAFIAVGPGNFSIVTIGKYVGEMLLVAAIWFIGSYIANDDRIKAPYSTILIVVITIALLFCIYKLWRL